MHRQPLLQLLAEYQQCFPEEGGEVDRLRDFVNTNPDCFKRSLLCGHVTGSAWLVDCSGQHVLLTHHKKLGRWLQLGGHADGDPDILSVARREAEEESGLTKMMLARSNIFDIDIHVIPERKSEPEHIHYDVRFAFQATEEQDLVVSEESNQLAWVDIAQLADLVNEPSMLRMASKWRKAR